MLDRRDQLGIKSEFVDECVRRSSNRKRYSRTLRKRFQEGLRPPTRAITEATRSTGIRSANPASKRKRLRCAPTKGLPTGLERGFHVQPNFVRLQEVSAPFRSGLRRRVARDMGRLNAGVRNSEAFARTRKTRSRELVLRTCSAFLNKLANENADAATRTAALANVAGRGRIKPAIRDARASVRSAGFRRSLEQSRRVGLRHAWREAETPG
jgi:hypothetical protein